MYKDFLDQDIKIGDWIVISNSGRGGTLYLGRVAGFKKNRMYYLRVYSQFSNYKTHTNRFKECTVVSDSAVPLETKRKIDVEWSTWAREIADDV